MSLTNYMLSIKAMNSAEIDNKQLENVNINRAIIDTQAQITNLNVQLSNNDKKMNQLIADNIAIDQIIIILAGQ